VHIAYNPWDRATRREGVSDARALAELVAAIDCDGIFLDTLSSGSSDLRMEVDKQRKGVVLVPELYPREEDLPFLMGSWYQFQTNPFPEPGILRHKWIEPRHMQYQISRWKGHGNQIHLSHDQEIENAFFNGSGMTVWENIFGTHNPWPAEDRVLWSHAIRILRTYKHHFVDGHWQPCRPTEQDKLFANQFTLNGETVFVLVNHGQPLHNVNLLSIACDGKPRAYDLWHGRDLRLVEDGTNRYQVIGSIDRLGGLLITHKKQPDDKLAQLLKMQRRQDWTSRLANDVRNVAKSVVRPVPVAPTEPISADAKPEQMVFVPRSEITMVLSHKTIECGCYPDPASDPSEWESRFFKMGRVQHSIGPMAVGPFFIDETEVTNAQFKAFLDATGYTPRERENFLKHWPDGRMPKELVDHPVVYVGLDDARAYAAWVGKRLPREEEWHLAAQGTDGRKWPWGSDDPTPQHVNLTGNRTLPARSCELGISPFGCYHMSGNVYEWTESERSDGHTRFAILRGGSYFDPHANPDTSSIWYNDGGPRPCDHHAKFILMYPGLDRCSTIGFRCVKDAGQNRKRGQG
jgi:formylglycine-generating enzyme required for sulfatase activity